MENDINIKKLLSPFSGVIFRGFNDLHRTMEFVDPEIEMITGYPPSNFIGNNVICYADAIHPEDRREVEKTLRGDLSMGEIHDLQYRVCHKNGSVRWVCESFRATCRTDHLLRLEGVIMDMSRCRRAEKSLEYRLRREHLISDLSIDFIDPVFDRPKQRINHALKKIGRFFDVDRCCILVLSPERDQVLDIYRWCRGSIEPPGDGLSGDLKRDDMCWLSAQCKKMEPVIVPDTDALSDGAAGGQSELKRRGVQSFLSVPIPLQENSPALIALDSVKKKKLWTEQHIDLLNIVSRIMGRALARCRREEQMRYALYHDHRTGLYNRTFFDAEVRRLDVERQLPLSLIMADVNGLKLVNDGFGHKEGDSLIRRAADILRKSCRHEDILVRWGGDEFVILLPQAAREQVDIILERIRRACGRSSPGERPLTLALGCGTKKSSEEDLSAIFKQAEARMYRDKLRTCRSARKDLLAGLLEVLECNSDYEIKEHSLRLEKWAMELGGRIGLSPSELKKLSQLTSLHEIGKTSIPKEILMKPGPLTEAEWEVMKAHPARGCRIASSTGDFANLANAILHLREWWDGSGYPSALKGEEIPVLSRITAIVDAYDAMISARSYRAPMSHQEAIDELRACAGSQFDPELVEAFASLFDSE